MSENMKSDEKSRSSIKRPAAFLILLICITILTLYVSRKWDYNTARHHLAENVDVHSRELKSHYYDFSYTVGPTNILDDNGILLADYKGYIGLQYNPTSICHYALGNHELYLRTGEEKHLQAFLRQADWLLENGVRQGAMLLWLFDFDNPYDERIKAPWKSAMVQGEAISVLLRAYQLTGQERYFTAAGQSLKSFYFTIEEGGVVYRKGDFVFLEESVFEPPNHILNGGIFAMLGLYDYYRVTADKDALSLFNEVTSSLSANLHRFDFGFWSKYELMYGPEYGHHLPLLATIGYQFTHIGLVTILYEITGDKRFDEYAKKWRKQSASFTCRLLNFVYAKIICKIARIPFYVRKKLNRTHG